MMRRVRVINRTRQIVLADNAELADNYWTRFIGLMGRGELHAGTGLVLKPGDRVTHVLRGIKPWRFGPLFVGNKVAIELPVGTADSTRVGDQIDIDSVALNP